MGYSNEFITAYFAFIGALVGAVGTIVAAYIAVHFGMRQFYSQKWWELRSQKYFELYDLVYQLKTMHEKLHSINEKYDPTFSDGFEERHSSGDEVFNEFKREIEILNEEQAMVLNDDDRRLYIEVHKHYSHDIKITTELIKELTNKLVHFYNSSVLVFNQSLLVRTGTFVKLVDVENYNLGMFPPNNPIEYQHLTYQILESCLVEITLASKEELKIN